MLTSAKKHLLNNLSLSVISLFLGYTIWHILCQPHKIITHISVPVSFYNVQKNEIESPEAVIATVHGTRKELYTLLYNLAVHIDAQTVPIGESQIKITAHNLFLPESVRLLHYPQIAVKKT